MKPINQIIILILTILISMASVHAQSPREQLTQMVEQLQKTPTDNALREKIIKLVQEVKPAPAIPDNAIEFEGRAQFAFKSAKSEADFLTAAHEYEQAIAAAPWVPGYYADLCTIYEKAGRFEDAKRNCESYLTGLTDSAQMTDVKRRIAGLKFGIEQANSEKQRPQSLAQLLQGKYGNRRITSKQTCGWVRAAAEGGKLTCNDSEAQGCAWTPGEREDSCSWMPMQKPSGGTDFISLNLRYQFRLNPANQNEIILVSSDPEGSVDWLCGSINGAEIKDIKWKGCRDGSPQELGFGTTSDGRPAIDLVKLCDAARKCVRDRRVLE